MSPEALQKLEILAGNEGLRNDFRSHVVNPMTAELEPNQASTTTMKQGWEENEFWRVYQEHVTVEDEGTGGAIVARESSVRGVAN